MQRIEMYQELWNEGKYFDFSFANEIVTRRLKLVKRCGPRDSPRLKSKLFLLPPPPRSSLFIQSTSRSHQLLALDISKPFQTTYGKQTRIPVSRMQSIRPLLYEGTSRAFPHISCALGKHSPPHHNSSHEPVRVASHPSHVDKERRMQGFVGHLQSPLRSFVARCQEKTFIWSITLNTSTCCRDITYRTMVRWLHCGSACAVLPFLFRTYKPSHRCLSGVEI